MNFVLDTPERARIVAERVRALDTTRPWELTLAPYRRPRTVSANRRLFKLHTLAGEATGHTASELHFIACGDYFGWHAIEAMGRSYQVPVRTTTEPKKLTAREFTDFMTFVESRYAEHLGVWLDG